MRKRVKQVFVNILSLIDFTSIKIVYRLKHEPILYKYDSIQFFEIYIYTSGPNLTIKCSKIVIFILARIFAFILHNKTDIEKMYKILLVEYFSSFKRDMTSSSVKSIETMIFARQLFLTSYAF